MPKKGSTFGGPAPVVEEADDDMGEDENFSLEALEDALGGPYNDLPPVVRRRVDALKNLHTKYLSVQKQYQAEVAELERKYAKLYDPIFDKREQIVSGTHEPTDEEAKVEKPVEEEGSAPKLREAAPEDAEIKGIPQYWLTVMQTNHLVSDSITENDEEALEFLKDVRAEELQGDKHGFTLTFHFNENPFFTNTTLTKTYTMEEDEQFGELIFDKAEGTKIAWKAGKNLTVKVIKAKEKGKKGKPARVVTKEEPQDSFFNFFSPPEMQEDSEDAEEIAAVLETDFDIGCTFKDKLIPFSLLWFTGEAAEFDDDFDEYDDEELDDEEGEDEEDDEEDDEDEPPRKGHKGGARGGHAHHGHAHAHPHAPAKGGPAQPPQPECKQQ